MLGDLLFIQRTNRTLKSVPIITHGGLFIPGRCESRRGESSTRPIGRSQRLQQGVAVAIAGTVAWRIEAVVVRHL